jgi:hypothetical protein
MTARAHITRMSATISNNNELLAALDDGMLSQCETVMD